MLLARRFESLPLVCPNCGTDPRIAAFITQAAPVARILNHLGAPAEPPRISLARGPPAWDEPTRRGHSRRGRPGATATRVRLRPAGAGVAVSRRLVGQESCHAFARCDRASVQQCQALRQNRPAPSQTAVCSPPYPVGSRCAQQFQPKNFPLCNSRLALDQKKFFLNSHRGISILPCKPNVARQVPMRTPFVRKQLTAAGLLHTARQVLGKIPDTTGNTAYSTPRWTPIPRQAGQ